MVQEETGTENSQEKIQPIRPEPITANFEVVAFDKKMNIQLALDALKEGYSVLITDYYSTGLAVLNALKRSLKKKQSGQSFQQQRGLRNSFREVSHRILLKIKKHKLTVKKAPDVGWFKVLYPELEEFLLPFSQVQGLNSSWQWYQKGMEIPVLKRKIHPWYGTYFPTRFDHLGIFDHWLQHYKGDKKTAIDVGIGSGILAYQMLNYGFEKIYGTDISPNTIIGLKEDADKNKLNEKLELFHGDLFPGINNKTELIVFNPPWLPGSYDLEGLDQAVYYDEKLFPSFFSEAIKYLEPEGKLVLLFSNLAQITGLTEEHPIIKELEEGSRFRKEYFVQKKVLAASQKTKRNQHWRGSEMVELWVLRLKD